MNRIFHNTQCRLIVNKRTQNDLILKKSIALTVTYPFICIMNFHLFSCFIHCYLVKQPKSTPTKSSRMNQKCPTTEIIQECEILKVWKCSNDDHGSCSQCCFTFQLILTAGIPDIKDLNIAFKISLLNAKINFTGYIWINAAFMHVKIKLFQNNPSLQ